MEPYSAGGGMKKGTRRVRRHISAAVVGKEEGGRSVRSIDPRSLYQIV